MMAKRFIANISTVDLEKIEQHKIHIHTLRRAIIEDAPKVVLQELAHRVADDDLGIVKHNVSYIVHPLVYDDAPPGYIKDTVTKSLKHRLTETLFENIVVIESEMEEPC